MTQSKKFDPDGEFIRRWVPELADAPSTAIHEPWTEPLFRASAGYPEPCLDYAEQRKVALDLLGSAGKDGASGR